MDFNNISEKLTQGDALTPLLFKFASEYTIGRVRVKQDDLKLNGTHLLSVYADDVNILGGSVHTTNKNREAVVVASKETGKEVHADNSELHGHAMRSESRTKLQYKQR